MKVFVCYVIPDSIGIDVLAIFDSEQKAKCFCDDYNKGFDKYDRCDYYDEEVQ